MKGVRVKDAIITGLVVGVIVAVVLSLMRLGIIWWRKSYQEWRERWK